MAVPQALREAGADVLVLDDHFPQNAEDEVWLAAAGQAGWIVLTADARIRTRVLELDSLKEHGAIAFILTAKHLTGTESAEILVRALPRMAQRARDAGRPALFTIGRDARPIPVKDIRPRKVRRNPGA